MKLCDLIVILITLYYPSRAIGTQYDSRKQTLPMFSFGRSTRGKLKNKEIRTNSKSNNIFCC